MGHGDPNSFRAATALEPVDGSVDCWNDVPLFGATHSANLWHYESLKEPFQEAT
jgi:hypothetical protein